MATKHINKSSTVKAVDADKKLIKWALEESSVPVVKNPILKKAIAADPTAGAVYTSKLDRVLYPKHGTAPSEIAAARKYTQGKERNHFKYFSKYGEMLEPTKEEIKRAKAPSMWEQIYDGMSPIEKGQHNAEKRKQGMNGKTAEPLVKQFRNDDPSTYLTNEDQMKGMLIATLEDAKPKPKKKINAYADVKIPIPVINHSLLRDPNQEAREAALEKTRAYAFSKRPDPDAVRGIGSFRDTVGRKLRAATSRSDWEKNNRTTYKYGKE